MAPQQRPVLHGQRASALAQLGGFTLVQASDAQSGTGSVTLALPSAASTPGTLLVATVLSPAAGTPFVSPAGSATAGWQLGRAVQCAGGRIEQWYWSGNPGGRYGPGSGAVFTGASGANCRGGIAELASPPGSTQVLDTVGAVTGTGYPTTVALTAAGGVFGGTLGVFGEAAFFASSPGSGTTWSRPAGYANLAQLGGGAANLWGWSCDGSLPAGSQSPAGGWGFATTVACDGWAGLLCCYRAVMVAPIGVVGGEVTNCLDLDPTGQQLVVGGDVEGCWRTANFGDNWQPADFGTIVSTADEVSFADIKWSLLEAGVLYACTGKTGSGSGAFLASADGGCTWQQRNDPGLPLAFYGNGTPVPPRPALENQDTDRTVNRLIAQDTMGGFLYLVTANNGVMRSPRQGNGLSGVTWTPIGLGGSGYYPRCIAINPVNSQELWVGAWDTGNGLGGVWHTTNARASSPGWSQLGGFTGTVADLKVVGSGASAYLYAACGPSGIYRAQVAPGGDLAGLNGTGTVYGGKSMDAIDTNIGFGITPTAPRSNWVSLDGYDDSGSHVIIAGCSGGVKVAGDANHTNIVQLTLPGGATPPAYADLTGPSTITTATLPPFGTPWWHAGASWQLWLGGSNSVNPHILIDPNDQQSIYVTGGGGFFRTRDGGSDWQLAVTGMPMIGMHCFAIDPNDGTHFVTCGDDYTSIDISGDPSGSTSAGIVETSPGAGLSGSHRESHAACFDPADSRVYVGLNTAYSQNSGGAVMYRAAPASSAWSSTGYDTQVSGAPAVTGLVAGRQAGSRFVVAVAQGQGIYRWDGTNWGICTENDAAPLPGTAGAVGQVTPLVAGHGAGYLYCFDRKQGLYRSTDYGRSWTQAWTVTSSDPRSGWLAVSPSVDGELWLSTDSNLYKLSGAGSGTVAGGGITVTTIGGVFSGGAAGIAFGPGGTLYAIALPGTSGVTTLYASGDDGQTWTDFGNGDDSVGSYGQPAGQLGISSSGWLWGATGEHFGYRARVPA
jgi:hypothetical protein